MSGSSSWLYELFRPSDSNVTSVPSLLIGVTVILLVGGGIARLWPRTSAAQRHLVWSAACWAVLFVPVLQRLMPRYELRILPAAAAPAREAVDPVATTPVRPNTYTQHARGTAAKAVSDPMLIATTEKSAPRRIPWTRIAFSVWGLGTLAVLVVLLRNRHRVNQLVASASPLVDHRVHHVFAELTEGAKYLGRVELKEHRSAIPMVCGLVRHVVVLPREVTTWSNARIRHVLLHELAHITRHDALTQAAASLAVAVYWFHPLAWVAARELRREREQASDDAVLAVGSCPAEYATDLLDLTTTFTQFRAASLAALTFARSSHMHERLYAVLDSTKCRTPVSRRATYATWTAAVGTVALVVGLTLHPKVVAMAAPEPARQRTVLVTAEDSGRVVSLEQVALPKDGATATARLRVPTAPGTRRLTVRVAPQPGDMVAENDTREVSVLVRNRLGSLGAAAPAQRLPNLPRKGRHVLARVRYAGVSDPDACRGSDSPEQGGSWSHDYPMSLEALMKVFAEVTKAPVDSFAALTATDSTLVQYPIAMVTEPGCWNPTEAEVKALQAYLGQGGLLFLDDLAMSDATPEHLDLSITRTEAWMKRVLPTGQLVPVPASDSLFNSPFKIDPTNLPPFGPERMQIMGIYKDNDPSKGLVVAAIYRGFLGHYWRYGSGLLGDANTPSGQAYLLGVNILHYGLSH